MVSLLENFRNSVLIFMFLQVFYSSILFAVLFVFGLPFKRSNVLMLAIWSLIFIRLVLPPTLSSPISGRAFLAKINIWDKAEETAVTLDHFQEGDELWHLADAVYKPMHDISDLITWQNILFALWMVGVVIIAGFYKRRYRYFRTLVKNATVLSSPKLMGIVNSWKKQFNIKRPVKLVCSFANVVPFTMGTLKPVICLSESVLKQGSSENLQSIIAHETAHIKRFDDLFIRLQSLIQILYFFHPVMWFASSRINMARECLCDEMVIGKKQISAREYATGLFQTIEIHALDQKKLVPIPAFGHQHNKLKQRFHNLKGENRMKKATTVLAALGIAIIALTVLPMAEVTVKSNSKIIAAEVTNDVVVKIGKNKVEKVDDIVVGRISARFGKLLDPFTNRERFHKAIDIAADKGTSVHSYADGSVIKVVNEFEKGVGSGKYLIIQHADGFQSRYTQLDEILVKEGQTIKAGEEIAKVGSTGRSTGPHLHFELIKDGEYVHPLDYLKTK